jgi:hypothetical protein
MMEVGDPACFPTDSLSDRPRRRIAMRRHFVHPGRVIRTLIVALAIVLMPTGKADAQFMGYGGWGYPGWGYGGWGWGGYGYPSIAYNYGYPGYGFGTIPVAGNFVMGAAGYGGYGGFGGYGYGFGGFGYAPGGIGMSGVGYWNPMFGVGLTPLGNYSYMMETRLRGGAPRAPVRYYGPAYRGW